MPVLLPIAWRINNFIVNSGIIDALYNIILVYILVAIHVKKKGLTPEQSQSLQNLSTHKRVQLANEKRCLLEKMILLIEKIHKISKVCSFFAVVKIYADVSDPFVFFLLQLLVG